MASATERTRAAVAPTRAAVAPGGKAPASNGRALPSARKQGLGNEIRATANICAAAPSLFAFLSDLENHWQLNDRFVEVVSLEGPVGARTGGIVDLRGPLGLRRSVKTRVLPSLEPRRMLGSAAIGKRTHARVSWTIEPCGLASRVELAARVESARPLDRLLLALGGRRWLRRRFVSTLERLAYHFETTDRRSGVAGSDPGGEEPGLSCVPTDKQPAADVSGLPERDPPAAA